ncbi:MAG TPA: thiol peroxidase [bacterium]|nr:thiol peroxidase [bacterium]
MERTGLVTFKGAPLTLIGTAVQAGEPAPDFTAIDQNLQPVSLAAFRGRVVIISSVPSLDTPVCSLQTQRFNREAATLNATVITISCDLPFAMQRFCDSFKVDKLVTLSDYREREFGMKYGLVIRELALLARAVMVIGTDGTIAYWQLVPEVAQEPDYAPVLAAARAAGA